MSEDRRQMSEDRGQKTEVRRQITDFRSPDLTVDMILNPQPVNPEPSYETTLSRLSFFGS